MYPRTIVLEDAKLKGLLEQKNELILLGREKSQEIEDVEKEIETIDKEVQAIEQAVDKKDLDLEAKAITEEMNAVMDKMRSVETRLRARLKEAVAPEIIKTFEDTVKRKEALEKERNKLGLKVQKFNDRIIPIARRLMKPHVENEYEDYDSIRLENGEIVASLFSHLEDFKTAHAKRVKK